MENPNESLFVAGGVWDKLAAEDDAEYARIQASDEALAEAFGACGFECDCCCCTGDCRGDGDVYPLEKGFVEGDYE